MATNDLAERLREEMGKGRVFVICNERDEPIGAITAEPGTGVERLLDALGSWQCPEQLPHKCLPVHLVENSRVVVESLDKVDSGARAVLVRELQTRPSYVVFGRNALVADAAALLEADGTRIADLEAKRKSCCICAADD